MSFNLNMKNNIFSVSVTFNPDIELFNRQIDSLHNQVQSIVIVDNASSNYNQLYDYIEQKKKLLTCEIVFISNENNLGLGSAQNIGIKYGIEKGATDILLLDQDSVLKENFIASLLQDRAELENVNIKVGALGPIYYNEVTKQVYPITKFIGPFIKRFAPTSTPEEASFLIASGCFISVDVLKEVGLMNEDLFIDFIDVDWCFRAQASGYKVYVSPRAIMMHTIGETRLNLGGRSIAVHSPLRRYYLYRNSVFMVRNKNIPFGYKLREITFNTFRLIVYFSVSKDRMKYLKYSFQGFKDGINGVGGECPRRF